MKPQEEKRRLTALLKCLSKYQSRSALRKWIPEIIGMAAFLVIIITYFSARDGNIELTTAIIVCVIAALIDGAMFMLNIFGKNDEIVLPYIDKKRIEGRINELNT